LTRQIRDRDCHPTLESHVKRAVMVSFPLLSPHHSNFFLGTFLNYIAIP
jgi:hypothetical protein